MKKLMIAAAIVCAAAFANAAEFNWKINSSDSMWTYDGCVSAEAYTGTGYLFANGQQQAVLDAFFAGDAISGVSGMLASNDIVEGNTSKNSATFVTDTSAGSKFYAFFAAVMTDGGKDYLFISDLGNKAASDTGAVTISMSPGDASYTVPFEDVKTFGEAGWYTTAAVPEPTSGLLLLLGVAGLALRRRRA